VSSLQRMRYHAVEDARTGPAGVAADATVFRGEVPAGLDFDPNAFNSDVDAARFYLGALFEQDGRPAMRGIAGPDEPENVPGLVLRDARDSPKTETTVVSFEQHHDSIPVFGSHAIVELNRDRELVSADASVGEVHDVPSTWSVAPVDALGTIEQLTGATIDLAALPAPTLVYFQDDAERWHLAWLFRDVPAAPPEVSQPAHEASPGGEAGPGEELGGAAEPEPEAIGGHLPGPSPRDEPRVDYLVDASDGDLLFYYSAAPTLNGIAPPPIPVKLKGIDEGGDEQAFWGNRGDGQFVLADPLRRTKTFDLDFADLASSPALPVSPIASAVADWVDSHRAAVSAHVNAQRVHDFYKGLLQRNGIDDGGMTLVSVVNCTWRPPAGSHDWRNAVWWDKKMWYGQTTETDGRLSSMSRYLDVIAHELTHGVVQFSSGLVYQGESGALNESFADIFGVIINNHYRAPTPDAVATWNWEIGPGFQPGGGPLRDLSDPTRTSDPAHYDNRYQGVRDYGGVHTNSGINNKAAHLLLTGQNDAGERNFTVDDAAVLLYLALTRLPPRATFADCRATLVSVARTYYSGDLAEAEGKVAAIRAAYDAVGVSEAV
jgi:bacillolysin